MGVWADMYLTILAEENPRELRRIRSLPEAARMKTLASIDAAATLHDRRLRDELGRAGDGVERGMRRELVVERLNQLAQMLTDETTVAVFQFVALQDEEAQRNVRIDVGDTPADGAEVRLGDDDLEARFEAELRRRLGTTECSAPQISSGSDLPTGSRGGK